MVFNTPFQTIDTQVYIYLIDVFIRVYKSYNKKRTTGYTLRNASDQRQNLAEKSIPYCYNSSSSHSANSEYPPNPLSRAIPILYTSVSEKPASNEHEPGDAHGEEMRQQSRSSQHPLSGLRFREYDWGP